MSQSRREALAKLTPMQLHHERLTILECAVRALIQTHPDRDKVRRIFDGVYAQHQIARQRAGAPAEVSEAMQGAIDMLFRSEDETSGNQSD